jgi:predicted enzyme related to lactoylglutathione lyase
VARYNPAMPLVDSHAPGTFCWIELATTNQNGAKKFYSSLFEWTAADFPMGPSETYTTFKLNGGEPAAAYTMREEERSMAPPHWNLYVAVSSADDTARRAGELGGKVLAGPFDVMTLGRMAVIQDPTGASLCVWQAKEHPGISISGESGTLCWADLNSPDPDRAKQFYEALFGWKLEPGEKDSSGYLHIKNGAEFIGGFSPLSQQNAGAPPHWMLYFQVADCDASSAKAKQLGAREYMAPMTLENVGRFSVVADPQGAVFSLFQPAPR